MVLYRSGEYRRYQIFASTDWIGGLYGSPVMGGTRPGKFGMDTNLSLSLSLSLSLTAVYRVCVCVCALTLTHSLTASCDGTSYIASNK